MEIILDNISKSYYSKKKEIQIFNNFNYLFKNGNMYVIKGESGRGKTTLLTMIALLQNPNSGTIYFDNKPVTDLSEKEKSKIRRDRIGIIFQDYNLFNELTVIENVILTEVCTKRQSKDSAIKQGELCLNNLGLNHRKDIQAKFISGGEQQRTSIARAIIKNPPLLICDEPISNLDEVNSNRIVLFLEQYCHQNGGLAIISSHDKAFEEFADAVIEI